MVHCKNKFTFRSLLVLLYETFHVSLHFRKLFELFMVDDVRLKFRNVQQQYRSVEFSIIYSRKLATFRLL